MLQFSNSILYDTAMSSYIGESKQSGCPRSLCSSVLAVRNCCNPIIAGEGTECPVGHPEAAEKNTFRARRSRRIDAEE